MQKVHLPKHQTLIAGSDIFNVLVQMHTGCNVRTLLFDTDQYVASFIVETFGRVIVA